MYEPYETDISYRYLKTVVSNLEAPICLLGGWAVHHYVDRAFKEATGRNYIGSRDIDLGFHFERGWSADELRASTFAKSMRIIEDELGFRPLGFRYLKEFHTETRDELSEGELKSTPLHLIFPLYIDPIVDIIPPKFYEVFNFHPIDEPLLEMVFSEKANRITVKSFGRSLWLPKPSVLLATKLNSLGGRDKEHKKLKDVADIFALLWFGGEDIGHIKSGLLEFYTKEDVRRVIGSISKEEIERVGGVIGISAEEIRRVLLEITM